MNETKHIKKTCFIITPIGKENSDIRRKMDGIIDAAIDPVLEECGFEKPKVSHRIQNSGSMTAEIIKGIYSSDLVIANLTGTNANVMYEVAIRHCAGKPIIHITEDIESIPFDISDHRCIEYTNDAMGVIELKEELGKKIKHIIENPDEKVSNPVLDYLERTKIIDEPQDKEVTVTTLLGDLENKMRHIENNLNVLLSDRNTVRERSSIYIINSDDEINSAKKVSEKNKINNYNDVIKIVK